MIPNWKFFELRKRHSKFTNRILLWLLKSCPKQTANQNKGSNSKTDLGVIKFLNMLLFWPEAICLSDTVKSVRLFSRRCLTCICGIFIFLLFAFSLLSFWGFSKKILYLSDSDFSTVFVCISINGLNPVLSLLRSNSAAFEGYKSSVSAIFALYK